jgi:hypothetical protein
VVTDNPAAGLSHFLVTRYNVAYGAGRRQEIHKNETWLSGRRQLFDQWCLPSVVRAAQDINVKWLILCATDSPDSVRDWIASLCEDHPWIVPIFLSGDTLQLDKYLSEQIARGAAISRYVLSTRLDSDDALHPDFLKVVQGEASRLISSQSRYPVLLNFPTGYQLNQGRLYLTASLANPYLSVLEDRHTDQPLISCYGAAHTAMHRHVAAVKQLRAISPYWIQVLHDTNEANRLGGLRVPRSWTPDYIPRIGLYPATEAHGTLGAVRRDVLGAVRLLKGCYLERDVYRASVARRSRGNGPAI